VIATSTKADISKVDLAQFEDKYFKATEKKTSKKGESEFFESEPEKKVLSILAKLYHRPRHQKNARVTQQQQLGIKFSQAILNIGR